MTNLHLHAGSFSAANLELVKTFTSGSKLWSVDMTARVPHSHCDVFQGVWFIECDGAAFICGIENEDPRPKDVPTEIADGQESFINYLRAQNAKADLVFGDIWRLFEGSEYASEGRATAAFIAILGRELKVALGYFDASTKKYDLICLEDSGMWLEEARSALQFNELG